MPRTTNFDSLASAQGRFFPIKNGRLDETAIRGQVDRVLARYLNRMGGAIRTTARRSMRRPTRYRSLSQLSPLEAQSYRRRRRLWHQRGGVPGREPKLPFKPSDPGTPPRRRSGLLRDFVFYARDRSSMTVVIGPVRLPGSGNNTGEVPRLHEYGGTGVASDNRTRARFRARPYMRPALAKIVAKHGKNYLREAAARG